MKIPERRYRFAKFAYSLCCNIPVCICLALAAATSGVSHFFGSTLVISFGDINWLNVLYNFLLSFLIAMFVSRFVPLMKIGAWFTGLFGIKNETYEGNVPYRLLATLIITVIFYVSITPFLFLLNYFGLKIYTDVNQAFLMLVINVPIMLIVGFFSSLISDIGAYKIGHKIDKDF